MNYIKNSKWDSDFCFHIGDFKKEDCIIVKNSKQKERGLVVSVNKSQMQITYKRADSSQRTTSIEDIVYLDSFKKGWLSKYG
jgi:hypothetical protein